MIQTQNVGVRQHQAQIPQQSKHDQNIKSCMPLTNINAIIKVKINFKASCNLLTEKTPKKCVSKHIPHIDTFINRHKVHALFKIGWAK